MKFYLSITLIAIFFSSCMKESIADAMLNADKEGQVTAKMSYEINGVPVSVTVKDADHQIEGYRELYCTKSWGYQIKADVSYGYMSLVIFTDSLQIGTYTNNGSYSEWLAASYQADRQFLFYPSDLMIINITSYKNGHVSGTFSGQLTPEIFSSNSSVTELGDPGSTFIKNGSFKNIPVYY